MVMGGIYLKEVLKMLIQLSDLSMVHGGKSSSGGITNAEQLMQRIHSDTNLMTLIANNPETIQNILAPEFMNICITYPRIIRLVADIDPAFLPQVISRLERFSRKQDLRMSKIR